MSHEVSPERAREIIIEKLNNFVLNYADVKKFDEIMKNRPMVEKERQKYDNTCWSLTDSLFMERIFFKDVFGKEIGTAIDKAFTDMYKEGKLQGGRESARRMVNDGVSQELITKYTGLPAEEIEGL